MAKIKNFKSPNSRFATYIGKTVKENRIQFKYGKYNTSDPRIIKGLMESEYYGIFFSLKEEFPLHFSKYQSKSITDEGNAQLVGEMLSENKNIKSENEDLKVELARLQAKESKSESDKWIQPNEGAKQK